LGPAWVCKYEYASTYWLSNAYWPQNVVLAENMTIRLPSTTPLCGMIAFTHAAELCLRIVSSALTTEPLQQGTEFEQVGRAERRSAASNRPEFVRRIYISQTGRNRAQHTSRARINDPVLAPI